MSKKNNDIENIELSLPVNAAYVSAARLTASSIANRLGFDVDEIEDIKAAVSEACTYIIKKSVESKTNVFKLTFCLEDGYLEILLNSDINIVLSETQEEMSLLMIKALMDKLHIDMISGDCIQMKMTKRHKINII